MVEARLSKKRQIRYSNATQPATAMAVVVSTLQPKTYVETARAGRSASNTSPMMRRVFSPP